MGRKGPVEFIQRGHGPHGGLVWSWPGLTLFCRRAGSRTLNFAVLLFSLGTLASSTSSAYLWRLQGIHPRPLQQWLEAWTWLVFSHGGKFLTVGERSRGTILSDKIIITNSCHRSPKDSTSCGSCTLSSGQEEGKTKQINQSTNFVFVHIMARYGCRL